MSYPQVRGVHDLIVHDYGPGRRMISLHAEVPAESDILVMHDAIDNIEGELRRRLQCDAVIHMDPIVTTDESVLKLKEKTIDLVKTIDARITMHDFRVVTGPTHTNLIFDVVIPYDMQMTDDEVTGVVNAGVKRTLGDNYFCVIQVDKAYVKD